MVNCLTQRNESKLIQIGFARNKTKKQTIAQDIITQQILVKMNFAGSKSDWYNVRDPEAEHHDKLFNGEDMQSYWHKTGNNELQHDKIKNSKWVEHSDYDKVTTSFD